MKLISLIRIATVRTQRLSLSVFPTPWIISRTMRKASYADKPSVWRLIAISLPRNYSSVPVHPRVISVRPPWEAHQTLRVKKCFPTNQTRRELWAKADKIRPYNSTFKIAYNADGGHQPWVEAVTNSIRQTLNIKAEGKAYPNFKGLRDDVVNDKLDSGYRTGWLGDYPSIANFLESQYRTKGSSNDSGYSNQQFDKLLSTAASSSSAKEAQPIYNQAQGILMQDLPQIPLWYKSASTAWNPKLKNFQTGWNGYPEFTKLTKEGDE